MQKNYSKKKTGGEIRVNSFKWIFRKSEDIVWYLLERKSIMYKTTTLQTIQKWSLWKGGRLIKHFYKTTTNQMWSLLAGF